MVLARALQGYIYQQRCENVGSLTEKSVSSNLHRRSSRVRDASPLSPPPAGVQDSPRK